ncbi:MAG: helix-turn-helix domain-containing protein [Ekhidna sp.]|nr:helix-turn-helix domain-containing protein [Ekhidna sp.]
MDYPFVIKKELDRVVIYSPDLEVAFGELPIPSQIKPEDRKDYYQKLGLAVLKAWQKGEAVKSQMISDGDELPEPSKAYLPTRLSKQQFLSPVAIASMAGCHKDTVRRAIDRGEISSSLSPGGHRRVLEADALKWIESRSS